MTQFYPGPYEVELQYGTAAPYHKMRLNLSMSLEGAVGAPFSAYSVVTRTGGIVALDVAVNAWVDLIKTQFGATVNFPVATLFKYVPNSNEKNFRSIMNVAKVGTGAAVQPQHQSTLTFITQEGNNMRIVLLEDASNANTRIPIDDSSAAVKAIADFVVGVNNWIKARDGSYPIGKLNYSGGQNEALFNRAFR